MMWLDKRKSDDPDTWVSEETAGETRSLGRIGILNRREAIQTFAMLAGVTALPGTVLASGHNVLRIAIGAEIGNLDLLQNVSPLHTYSLVFESLIRYGDNGNLEPALAESWEVSEDGMTLSFNLRQGVSFTDGTPFDSEAAKWNLERWMGKPDFSWIGVSDALESIVTTGSHSLDIQLKREVPVALLELTIVRPVRFLSPAAVDAGGMQAAPIGTGPWVIVENSNEGTTLERNENHWGGKPALERIELKVVPDELSRSNGLRAGDLDIIGGEWVAPLSPPACACAGPERRYPRGHRAGYRRGVDDLLTEVRDAGRSRGTRGRFAERRPQFDRAAHLRGLRRSDRQRVPGIDSRGRKGATHHAQKRGRGTTSTRRRGLGSCGRRVEQGWPNTVA